MKALLLAAGEGRRLHPLTLRTPKALIPVLNIPLMEFGLAALAEAAVKEIVVNAHHLADQVVHFGKSRRRDGASVEVVRETALLGTGGALKNVASEFARAGTFFIANADILHGIDLKALCDAHLRGPALATLALRSTGWEQAGGFCVDEAGWVREYLPPGEKPPSGMRAGLFTGLHVLESDVFQYLPQERVFCIVQKLYRPLIDTDDDLVAARFVDNEWSDLGTPRRYLEASLHLLAAISDETRLSKTARRLLEGYGYRRNENGIWLAHGGEAVAGERLRGPALVEQTAHVAPDGRAGPLVILGEGATLAPRTRISQSLVWPNAAVPSGSWRGYIFPTKGDPIEAG